MCFHLDVKTAIKEVIKIALAFVGLVVGAGFASGQEILQYFVSYGTWGIAGAVLTAVIIVLVGLGTMQLGSYFLAEEHSAILHKVFNDHIARVIDWGLVATLFCFGFVMIAGAGANLNQQFGLPNWVGAAIIVVLTLIVGMMDVDKVTAIIGAITPLVFLFVVGAGIYTFVTCDTSFEVLDASARSIASPMPNWWLSAINYVGLALVLALSMAIVMGGDQLSPRIAGMGGLGGGLLFSITMIIATLAIFMAPSSVREADMPMLELVNTIHPTLGLIMAFVIFGMIFNTATCMYYSLAKRASAINPRFYKPTLFITALAGFGLSFLGFKTLVSQIFPIIGWAGLIITAAIFGAWLRRRTRIKKEVERRGRIRFFMTKMLRKDKAFTHKDRHALKQALDKSPAENYRLYGQMLETVADHLDSTDAPLDNALVERERERVERLEEAARVAETTEVAAADTTESPAQAAEAAATSPRP